MGWSAIRSGLVGEHRGFNPSCAFALDISCLHCPFPRMAMRICFGSIIDRHFGLALVYLASVLSGLRYLPRLGHRMAKTWTMLIGFEISLSFLPKSSTRLHRSMSFGSALLLLSRTMPTDICATRLKDSQLPTHSPGADPSMPVHT